MSLSKQSHDNDILYDNAHPHVAVPVKNYLKTLDWEILPHPSYSSDIASSDYRLFRSMAHVLSEQPFLSYEDTINWVDSCITSKDKEFFRLGIRTMPERWRKAIGRDRNRIRIEKGNKMPLKSSVNEFIPYSRMRSRKRIVYI
ncbi:Mariner Mos1 transposase [Eumeta japonica]|uniref:Mariner Mos1 transposase n=1 Tax=Eumeta variegata TaxID=151549 RepID=A0A4C1WL21_EUMVA|nr:Mariner Mos1 transposase [Eumeta japonica]